jgi:hypothetical protein
MKLIGKVPVEPLDDERLTNIERNLVVAVSDLRAPAPHASRRALAFAGVAMAMAIALAGFAGWKLHKAPAVEAAPQTFAMKSDTKGATLDLGDAQLASMPGTHVRVERTQARTSIEMAHGTLDLTVEHKPGRLLVVRAGDTEIEDVGTKFSVLFDGKSHVEVRVVEGEVKVRRAAKDFAVTASNAWTTELGSTTIAQLDAAAVDVVAGVGPSDVDAANVDAANVDAANVGTANVGANAGANVGANAGANDVGTNLVDNRAASGTANRGSAAVDNRGSGSDSRGSDSRGTGSASHKKGRATNITKAILAVPLNPLPGTITDYNVQLSSTARDKSRVMYSIAVAQHLAKNDAAALHSIEGNVKQRTSDEAYKDSMWLQVRIRCLEALDDNCKIAAQRYLNAIDAGNIPSGPAGGVAQAILKEIAL